MFCVSAVLSYGTALSTFLSPGTALAKESLRGSSASLDRQNRVAQEHDYSYLDTPHQVRRFAAKGWLVRIRPNNDFRLKGVSFPYARPEVQTFLERLSAQYHAACGERLVVTSLTRPTTRQPRNASDRSVHPTGMAIDLRRSRRRDCQRWIERVLLDLEGAGVLEATRERRPVHYHVALFPRQYTDYVAGIEREEPTPVTPGGGTYTVARGDSLWTIAQRHGTTVAALQSLNGLRGTGLRVGDSLQIPGAEGEPAMVSTPTVAAATPDSTPSTEPEKSDTGPSEAQVAEASRVEPSGVEPALVAEASASTSESAPTATVAVFEPEIADASESAAETDASAGRYTVRRGDSLWTIAQASGTSVSEIRRANGLRSNLVQVGQELEVPGSIDDLDRRSYTVRRGDSLWTIAQAAGTSVRELRQANGLRSNLVRVGQELRVPGSSLENLDRRSYTVRSGDTLWIIAREHGTTVRKIRSANGLRNSRIYVGQVLELPTDG